MIHVPGVIRHCTSHSGHDATVRNVVAFAHEVRVVLRDARVIVGSIIAATGDATDAFEIRPWGLRSPMTLRFGEVARAVPVRRMLWARQRCISAAQTAGTFSAEPPRQPNRPDADELARAENEGLPPAP